MFHTNNALEYVKNNVSLFCAKNEIIRQTSYSHTSQENDIAERNHKHILDVVRTMMIHMNVPKYLWSDAVLSACHLFNRLPSSVLRKRFHSLVFILIEVFFIWFLASLGVHVLFKTDILV